MVKASSKNSTPVNEHLERLWAPHVESFNFFLDEGLPRSVQSLDTLTITAEGQPKLKIWLEEVQVQRPFKEGDSADVRLTPRECRELGSSYLAPMFATVCRQVDDGAIVKSQVKLSSVPIMVKSKVCHLSGMSQEALIASGEEKNEMGGYFIINGNERLIRLLIAPRRNYPTAIVRPSYTNRGSNYTKYGIQLRCCRDDQSSQTLTLHYLSDGTCTVRVTLRKNEFFIPAIILLKAFVDATDRQIYECMVRGDTGNSFLTERAEINLREGRRYSTFTQQQCLSYLGSRFRVILYADESMTDAQVGHKLLNDHLFVHLDEDEDKFHALIMMMQKMFALVNGRIQEDNTDALMHHEVYLPGHLYSMIVKEKLQEWLGGIRTVINKDIRLEPAKVNLRDASYLTKVMQKNPIDVGRKLEYFMATGNLVSRSGLDLMQTSGFTVVGEKLNYYRYLSHFRSIHRGQFFTEMKTTTVRKLLPESWGFLCPVHTPDGSPCGLLNHLAAPCDVVQQLVDTSDLPELLCSLGMSPRNMAFVKPHDYLDVHLDGRLLGTVDPSFAQVFADKLRHLKIEKHPAVPDHLEIALIHQTEGGLFPGVFLVSTPARFIRPVQHLGTMKTELIGSLEQVFMEVACLDDDIDKARTTHREILPTNILSVIASMTPFSDFNQSPRNMYQCQMGKQSMGTPAHSLCYRTDNKMYRLQNPQRPIVRNDAHDKYEIDDYLLGMNAVVAVISYTGYDMEDAMILNKMCGERGFGHGSVYKVEEVDLSDGKTSWREKNTKHFGNYDPSDKSKGKVEEGLDDDGLPFVGQLVRQGDPLYCVVDTLSGRATVKRFKDQEQAFIEEVRILGSHNAKERLQKISIKYRYNRNPVIGDKFSSRHGQKGVCSVKWPTQDMPFTESGMTPDVIINPHAFPSRMTIGMLVESMAGKSGACHAKNRIDGTPFRFSEQNRAVDHFGEQLRAAGYNYLGNEPMYSGVTGEPFAADIYIGVVYYQRLRHMVSDKFQVRSTGPINQLTRQPIKGRKVQGGIRLGEMERDALIAHGAAFLLHDRLFNCSDQHKAHVCGQCGSLVTPLSVKDKLSHGVYQECRSCKTGKAIRLVNIPYVFMFLVNELAAMNIKLTLKVN